MGTSSVLARQRGDATRRPDQGEHVASLSRTLLVDTSDAKFAVDTFLKEKENRLRRKTANLTDSTPIAHLNSCDEGPAPAVLLTRLPGKSLHGLRGWTHFIHVLQCAPSLVPRELFSLFVCLSVAQFSVDTQRRVAGMTLVSVPTALRPTPRPRRRSLPPLIASPLLLQTKWRR